MITIFQDVGKQEHDLNKKHMVVGGIDMVENNVQPIQMSEGFTMFCFNVNKIQSIDYETCSR